MKQRSKRGVARVGAVWLVVFVVLFLAAISVAWSQADKASKTAEELVVARADLATAQKLASESHQTTLGVSQALGFYDPAVQNDFADPALAKASLDKLKLALELPEALSNYESSVEPLINHYAEKQKQIETLQGQIKDLQGQNAANVEAAAGTARTQKAEIDRLTKELSDERNGRTQDKDDSERRFATVTSQRNSLDAELKALQGQLEDEKRARERDQQEHTTRMNHVMSATRFVREPEKVDGEILATSKTLGLAWINLGAADRVSRGMEFRVDSGKPSEAGRKKGMARVTAVEEARSEVEVYDLVDPWDPVATGDKIANPLYDPEGGRNAVLIGRFSGIYNEKELRMLLDQIGIHVQPKVDRETDYLIVGAEQYEDESGEPLEEPIEPSDLPEYKQAEAEGVQIVPIRDIVRYFKK